MKRENFIWIYKKYLLLYYNKLYFKEVINIFILRFCEEIDNYKYDYSYLDTNKKIEIIISSESTEKINANVIQHIELNGKIEDIIKTISQTMKEKVTIGVTYEYKSDNYSVFIYPFNSELLKNETHIESFECLSNKSTTTIFQIEILNGNKKSLVNKVEYQAFDEQKNPIDLSQCNNSNIKIIYGIKNNSNLDKSVVNSFINSSIDVI